MLFKVAEARGGEEERQRDIVGGVFDTRDGLVPAKSTSHSIDAVNSPFPR